MKEDLLEDAYICISKDEYLDLVDQEARVNVLVGLMVADCKLGKEEILRILGTELAIVTANELREKRRNETENFAHVLEKLHGISRERN